MWAGTTGQLDDIEVGDVRRFETELLQWIKRHRKDTYTSIESTNNLTDDNIASLEGAVVEFKKSFQSGATATESGN